MIKTTLFLLLIAHFIADFYLQSKKLSEDKRNRNLSLIIHCGIHFVVMFIATISILSLKVLVVILVISLLHYLIDWSKIKLDDTSAVYVIDQLLHILVIFVAARLLGDVAQYYTIPFSYLSWALALVIIINPVKITLQKTLIHFKPEKDYGFTNAGAVIGIIERVLILLLLSQGQYIIIGFVITAKSIVRYDQISKDIKFSEYYLLGTLASLLCVVVVYMLVLNPL